MTNNHYKFRWFYAITVSVAIVMIGWIYALQPGLERLSRLHAVEIHLQRRLERAQKNLSPRKSQYRKMSKQKEPKSALLEDVLMLFHLHGLVADAIDVVPGNVANVESARVVAEADFSQLFAFISALNAQASPIFLTDFSYRLTKNNRYLLTMDLMKLTGKIPVITMDQQHAALLQAIRNPFCPALNVESASVVDLQSVPLAQLKMTGYVRVAARAKAFITLPSGAMLDVSRNAVIGKEQGVVMDIQPEKVMVQMRDKSRVILHM